MSYSYFRIKYYDSDLSGSLRLNPQSEVLCGARLTSPQDLFILSVDPMADKYPNIPPYAYCAWNPVNLIDPNGDTIRIQDDNGQFRYIELSHISSFCNSKDPREKALYFMSNDAVGYAILKGLSISSVYYDIKNKSNMKGGRVDDERIVVWGKPAYNYG